MSKTDTCTRCDQYGHNSAACKIPIAPHVVEPYDGHDDLKRCSDCLHHRAGCKNRWYAANYVPSMKDTPQRCAGFLGRPA